MSASGGKNCSISSFLPMSCREKAEVFARHLQSRLSSLDRNGDISAVNENSWLGSQDSSSTVSHQPRQSIDLNLDLNGVFFESPGSPEEENADVTIVNNNDSLLVKPTLNGFKSPEFQNGHSEELCEAISIKANDDTPLILHNDKSNNLYSSIPNNHAFETLCDLLPKHSQESLTINELTNANNSLNENTATFNTIKDDTCTYFPKLEAQYANQKIVVEENEDVTDCNVNVSLSSNNGENCNINSSKGEVLGINDKEEIFLQPKNLLNVPFKNDDECDDEIDSEHPIPRVRRCSSLKTGKTPPGTPRKKKIVHFADVLGLELTCVRSFLDEVPRVPNSAFNDLRGADLNNSTESGTLSNTSSPLSGSYKPERILCAMFQQPGGQPNFLDMVKEKNVCLENAFVDDPIDLSIKGTIRVRNLDFHKSVYVRYSLDSWKTFADLQATYIENSCDGFSDTFSFMMFAHTLTLGQSLQFAIRFHCKGSQYWDSNYGINYIFQCLPASKQQVDHLSIENFGESWDPKFY